MEPQSVESRRGRWLQAIGALAATRIEDLDALCFLDRAMHDLRLVAWWADRLQHHPPPAGPGSDDAEEVTEDDIASVIDQIVHRGIHRAAQVLLERSGKKGLRPMEAIFGHRKRFLELRDAIFGHAELAEPWGLEPVEGPLPAAVYDVAARVRWTFARVQGPDEDPPLPEPEIVASWNGSSVEVRGSGLASASGRHVQASLASMAGAQAIMGWPSAPECALGEARGRHEDWHRISSGDSPVSPAVRITPDGSFEVSIPGIGTPPTVNHVVILGIR